MQSAELYESVGLRIRKAREERKMTQSTLAKLVSLTRTSITNIESGKQKLLLDTLFAIADALGVDAVSLLPDSRGSSQPREVARCFLENFSWLEQERIRWMIVNQEGGPDHGDKASKDTAVSEISLGGKRGK